MSGFAKGCYIGLAERFPVLRRARALQWMRVANRYRQIASSTQVDDKRVFFESFNGKSYSCSPRALFEAMSQDSRFDGWTFIWSFDQQHAGEADIIPKRAGKRVVTVQHGSDDYLRALATSRYWIQNNRIPELIEPEQEHVYVQCWHGTPLKKLGFDVSSDSIGGALNTPQELAHRYLLDAQKWTYLISPSDYTTRHLCSAFGVSDTISHHQILEVGYPRNDSIVNTLQGDDAQSKILRLKQKFGIPPDKKVLLYAPTYREDSYKAGTGYTFDLPLNLKVMRNLLSDDWVVLLRMHYHISSMVDVSPYRGFAIDVSSANDINELYCVSDALCTDYSSVFFDYANTGRPLLFLWPDYTHYVGELHGTYLALDSLPGPKCTSTPKLIQELRHLDTWHQRYGASYQAFRETFCPYDDGHASERAVQCIFADPRKREAAAEG